MRNAVSNFSLTYSTGRALLLGIAAFTLLPAGCVTYRFGSAAMFRTGIRTIHVPIVRNDTFRHDLGIRLTEAITNEIENRTPYKVTGDPNADSTLTCRVTRQTKQVLSEADTDDPRALNAVISVRSSWVSREGELLMQNSVVPSDDISISFAQESRFVPEAGQSVGLATQAAIEQLATSIVSQMELRW
ncbi:MAG: LPS assembly lipoprotein LptE [Rubripirellula sp.]|nr:hypothetical protein [Rhodopirellula sp.]MCH1438667.1 LPS assembly lipoprotein LptE [Rubripirellula sp.]OUX08166.1 MAG: hypothetical protein CBE00_02500 [Planctomycetaceae bacterium TMED240]